MMCPSTEENYFGILLGFDGAVSRNFGKTGPGGRSVEGKRKKTWLAK